MAIPRGIITEYFSKGVGEDEKRNDVSRGLRREIILEALEDRIVLDGAVDHTLVDIAAQATEAVGAGATSGVAAHGTDAAGVDPTGYWSWEHNAWCYHDSGFSWWWWPDASSPQGGNWLYQGAGSTGMWNYDWNDGWEWFFDAFYNDRYYQDSESGVYWGQDGQHNWYFTPDPHGNMDFSTWTAAVGHSGCVVNVDFDPSGSGGLCQDPSGPWWVSYGSVSSDVLVLAADINPGPNASFPVYLTAFDGDLYFQANDGTHGIELWRYDSGAGTAQMAVDIWTGANNSLPAYLTVFDGDLYFRADDGTNGYELWRIGSLADI